VDQLLPDELIEKIQEYVDGTYIYIPRKKASTRSWGEVSGTRSELEKRNQAIQSAYLAGRSINQLAESYFLAPNTIRKILWRLKKSS